MSDDLSGDMLAPSWPNLVVLGLIKMQDGDLPLATSSLNMTQIGIQTPEFI